MKSTTRALTVPFHGAELFLVERGGQPYAPMKPIVEGMGLKWQPQHRKLHESRFNSCVTEMVIQMPGDGQRRSMICLPLRKLPGWLMSISPGKVKETIVREKVIQYQNECDDVLWDYWTKGSASNDGPKRISGTTAQDRAPLKTAVNTLINIRADAGRRSDYAHAWRTVNGYLGVQHIAEASPEQIEKGLAFVQKVIEGELLGPESLPASPSPSQLSHSDLNNLHCLCTHMAYLAAHWRAGVGQAVKSLNEPLYNRVNEHVFVAERQATGLIERCARSMPAARAVH